jgi:uncharacterized protein (TIGR02145 family)
LEYENYYVIAFAENASGRSYGEQVSLQTLLPEDMFIDHRDGNAYKWVAIGPQIWMAENLAYLPELRNPNNYSDTIPFYYVYGYYGFKVGEAKTTFNYNTYGVLYNYPAATDACPDGWRLPTSDEEQALISYIGGEDEIERILDVGTDHWNTNPAGNNSTGFTALGAGWANLEDNGTFGFENLRTTAGFWKVDTCSQDSLNGIPYIIESGNPFRLNDLDCAPFANGYSVRCIKE